MSEHAKEHDSGQGEPSKADNTASAPVAPPVEAAAAAPSAKPAETPKQADKADAKTAEKSSKQVDKVIHKENAQGFVGTEVDSTPNENYTIAGVIKGKPTPETDDKAAAQARKDAGLR